MHKMVVAVFAFIEQEEGILLVRQGTGRQYWSLPGGVVEEGESLDKAVIREVKEETGLDVQVGRLVAVYSKLSEDAVAVTFQAEVTGGTAHADNEILECGWFPIDSLPDHARGHLRQRVADYATKSHEAIYRAQ